MAQQSELGDRVDTRAKRDTAIYNGSGGSVRAVAVWHALYNLCAATATGEGAISAVVTGCVIFWAVSLIQRERAGIPALGEVALATGTR